MMNQSPIPGLTVAGPNDLKEQQVAEVHMDVRWVSYFNLCVLTMLQACTTGRLTHVKFVPDVANGLLYVLPAQADEYGAEQLDYAAPENGANVSLYVALLKFNLEKQKGRLRVFTVLENEVEKGKKFLALNVRESKTVPAKSKSKKDQTAPATQVAAGQESQA